jgi:hypothetical protein
MAGLSSRVGVRRRSGRVGERSWTFRKRGAGVEVDILMG